MQQSFKRKAWDYSDAKRRRPPKKKKRRKNPPSKGGRMQVYGAAASQLWSDVKLLKSLVNAELHFLDVTGAAIAVGQTPVLALLNGSQVGDTSSTRTGQSIKMDSLDFRFNITGDGTATRQFVRLIIVLDHQVNGTAMTAAQLLSDATNPQNLICPYLDASQMRFKPIFDESIAISTTGQGTVTKRLSLRLPDHVMYNVGTVGDVTDIVTNAVWLIYLSDQSVNKPLLQYYSRIWFIDN